MRYYSAHNLWANETSIGFANTWYILAWESRKARDAHVKERCRDPASRAIKRDDIGKYIHRPKASSGMRWSVVDCPYALYPGCLGRVLVTYGGQLSR